MCIWPYFLKQKLTAEFDLEEQLRLIENNPTDNTSDNSQIYTTYIHLVVSSFSTNLD